MLLLVWALLWPATAASQEKAAKVQQALAPDVVERIEAIVATAAGEGVPVDPLYDKALEGAAKGIPGSRIVPAVSAYADRLRVARAAMGPLADAWVIAGADAVARGVPAEALSRVVERGRDQGPMAVVVLGDLVEAGVPTDRAVDVIEEAARSGQDEADVVAIPGTVDRFIRDGATPRDAALRLMRHMRRGLPVRRVNDVPGGLVNDRPGPPVAPGVEPVDRRRRPGG